MIHFKRGNRLGFTLLELLIAITIVAILAAVAVPTYLNYVRKAQASELVQFADGLKPAVNVCIQELGTATGCSEGANGIPTVTVPTDSEITAASISDGVITVNNATLTLDYVLTGTPQGDTVNWAASGSICTNNLIKC